MLSMGWDPGDEQIAWMNSVIRKYPERKVWIDLHEYLLTTGTLGPIPQRIFDEVVKPNPNVFAVSSGHYHDAYTRTDDLDDDGDGVADRTVYSMLFDYQGLPEGGLGYLRLLHFDNAGQKMIIRTYSPSLDDFDSDDASLNDPAGQQEFEIPYAAVGIAPQTKTLGTDSFRADVLTTRSIATFQGVASGSTVDATWPGVDRRRARMVRRDHRPARWRRQQRRADLHGAGTRRAGDRDPGHRRCTDRRERTRRQRGSLGSGGRGARLPVVRRRQPDRRRDRHRAHPRARPAGQPDHGPGDRHADGLRTEAKTSAPTSPVAAGAIEAGTPVVTGVAGLGRTLVADPGTWGPDGVALGYQWYAGSSPIAGATRSTLALGANRVGKRITVRVTGTLPGYTATTTIVGPDRARRRRQADREGAADHRQGEGGCPAAGHHGPLEPGAGQAALPVVRRQQGDQGRARRVAAGEQVARRQAAQAAGHGEQDRLHAPRSSPRRAPPR